MPHVPGPWMISNGNTEAEIVNDDGRSVANFSGFVDISDEQADANAALICAAPDLIAACKELIAALNEPDEALRRSWLIDAHNKAGAAITKAEKPQ